MAVEPAMVFDRTKLCVDCRFFGNDSMYRECRRMETTIQFDVAYGERKVISTRGSVDRERTTGQCGPSAKFFEPKPRRRQTWWRRLLSSGA